ncbi:hypothetical protein C8A01DRAFT_34301 [Parachaetomium inaequale]|uniref:Uncharacterized protein n=1 Tax=Parachaetomium inaequale TaxID=2588326 RepID=A0AAN6PKD1_9PEZI|nr:hypothetical protein C8A01DRAFT_34301 [Parachaetomium inaequale]
MPLRGEIIAPSVSLDARSVQGTYHWGLIIMDSAEKGSFHHATNPSGGWKYEKRNASPAQSITLITVVRVSGLNGSVQAATDVIQSVPADGSPSQRTGEAFRCLSWLKDAIVALDAAGIIQLPMDIDTLIRVAKHYAEENRTDAELGHGAYVEKNPDPNKGDSYTMYLES